MPSRLLFCLKLSHASCPVCWQAGLRSELEIATDEMERAQQRLAALEREKEVLQGTTSPTASQAASRAAPNKLVEESLRNELQNQVCSFLAFLLCQMCSW